MALADSNYGRVSYVAQSTFGTLPTTPTMTIARITSSDFSATKDTVLSDEIRSDRNVANVIEVAASSGGTLNFELSLGTSFKDFIQAALCGTWSTAVNFTGAVTFASGSNTITDDATSGAFTNVVVGQWIWISDAVDTINNGWHKVTAKASANQITVATSLAAESADTITIKGQYVRNGTTKRSFSIEQAFTDINQFFIFKGQRVSSMALNVASGAIVTGSFAFMGTEADRAGSTYANALTAATTTDVVNATSNVGTVVEGGTTLTTALQSISLNVDNALRNQAAIANKYPAGIGYGRQTVSGSITAYFVDGSLYDKFLDHTSSSLSFDISDAAGNRIRFTLPKVYFQTDNPTPGGIDQDVVENLDFTAVYDSTTNCQIQIDVIAA